MNTQWLWIQEKHARDELKFGKVDGASNWADLMTKNVDQNKIEKLYFFLILEVKKNKMDIQS